MNGADSCGLLTLDFGLPGGRKTRGIFAPVSAWTDDCKHRAQSQLTSTTLATASTLLL